MKGWVLIFLVGFFFGFAAGGPSEPISCAIANNGTSITTPKMLKTGRKGVNPRDFAKTGATVKKPERKDTTSVRIVDFSNMPFAVK